jgi:hypothetical protein
MPRKGVIHTIVIENEELKEITDFVSYFAVGVTITNNNKFTQLNVSQMIIFNYLFRVHIFITTAKVSKIHSKSS